MLETPICLCTLVNIEDPDKMLHNGAFHQGIYRLLKQKQSSEKKMQYYLEIITCDPSYNGPSQV